MCIQDTCAFRNQVVCFPLKSPVTACTVTDKPEDVAHCFAEYFDAVLSTSSFPPESQCAVFPSNCQGNKLHTLPFSERETSALKAKWSLASDGLPSFLVKARSRVFVPLLTRIFNASLFTGVSPELLKHGVIEPAHKSGNSCDVTKYQTITLQSPFAKVFEIVLFQHLWFYFKSQTVNAQHGFYKG